MSALRVLVALGSLTFLLGAATPAQAKTVTCKAADLGYEYSDGDATYSSAVSGLRATNASCAVARRIARTTNLALLFGGRVPAKLEGFTLAVAKPCPGCAPRSRVVARNGSKRVTFTVNGGA